MKLFARLISHAFAIGLVVLLAIGFIYRGDLFPELGLPQASAPDTMTHLPEGGERAPLRGEVARVAPADSVADHDPALKGATAEAETADVRAGKLEGNLPALNVPRGKVATSSTSTDARTTAMQQDPPAKVISAAGMGEGPAGVDPAGMETPIAKGSAPAGTTAVGSVTAAAAHLSAADKDVPPGVAAKMDAPTPVPIEKETKNSSASPSTPVVTAKDRTTPEKSGSQTAIEDAKSQGAPVAAGDTRGVPDTSATGTPRTAATTAATDLQRDSASLSQTLLGLAREAYWMQDFTAAEHYYRRMIAIDPENPDGYGELANIYFSRGDRNGAAAAYYEAGVRLLRRGSRDRAVELVEVLRILKSSQASVLEKAIGAAEPDTP